MTKKEREALYSAAQDALSESRAANLKASAIIAHIRGIEQMIERRHHTEAHIPERRHGGE